jgi:hypothetical protein
MTNNYSRYLMGLLTVGAAAAFLQNSAQLPTGWLVHVVEPHHVVAGRVALVPSLILPAPAQYPSFVASIAFDVRDGEATATASGLALPRDCCCDKSRLGDKDRCVCVSGPLAEIRLGLDKALATHATRTLAGDGGVGLVLDAWEASLKEFAGGDVCHGCRHADVEARIARDPAFTTASAIDLHPPAHHDLDGTRINAFFARSGCAVLVNGSSKGVGAEAAVQEPHQRRLVADEHGGAAQMDVDEPGPAEGEEADQEETLWQLGAPAVAVCDTCFAAKRAIYNLAPRAREAADEPVHPKAPTSRLDANKQVMQAAGKLSTAMARIKALEKEVKLAQEDITQNGTAFRAPNNKMEEGLFRTMEELREHIEAGGAGTEPSSMTDKDLSFLRAQEQLSYAHRKKNGTLNGMRWSAVTLVKAHQLLCGNSSKYNWLRESGLVSLPSESLLKQKFGSNDVTGHEEARYDRLAVRTAHLSGQCRYGALNRDEMKIEEGIVLRKMDGDEWALIGYLPLPRPAAPCRIPRHLF